MGQTMVAGISEVAISEVVTFKEKAEAQELMRGRKRVIEGDANP